MSTYLWTQGEVVGNADKTISPYLKTWIGQDGVVVCGVTGEGTSKEVAANWDSPFEGENVGSKFSIAAGALQSGVVADITGVGIGSGVTSISTHSSRQVWNGSRPTQFNIVLQLYALYDPQREVMDPIIALHEMFSPELNRSAPGGRIPGMVTLNVGRNVIYPNCVIESISEPLDATKNSAGLFTRAEINLSLQTIQIDNKSDIRSRYG